MAERTSFIPSSLRLSAEDYFLEYRRWRAETFGTVDLIVVEGEEGEDATEVVVDVADVRPPVEVLEPWTETEQLGRSAKAFAAAAEAMTWKVRAATTRVRIAPVLYKGDGEDHSIGDVRFAEREETNLFVAARHPAGRLGFYGAWVTRSDNGKTAFDHVIVYDPLGVEVVNEASYARGDQVAKEFGEAKARQWADAAAALYNDGTARFEKEHLFLTATPFREWMDGWLDLTAPDHKRLTPQKKNPTPEVDVPAEPLLADLTRTEWSPTA